MTSIVKNSLGWSTSEKSFNSETSDTGLKQLLLQATLNKVKPYTKDSHKYQILVYAVGEFIFYGLQPINVADEPSFSFVPSCSISFECSGWCF